MRGTIKAYSVDVNAGVISGENGKSYGFAKSEWRGKAAPVTDEAVTFDGERLNATEVHSEK